MNTLRVSVSITGTDDNGDSRPWSASGIFQCLGATDQTLTVTSTAKAIVDAGAGDQAPTYVYVENYGDGDIALGFVDPNGITISHAIPSGAATIIKAHSSAMSVFPYIDQIQLWTDSGTSEVRYVLFY